MPGEAVTLQLGRYAGCVGAHWWGLQAAALRSPGEAGELRATALLRAGRDAQHTPRLVALELKGGVSALSAGGADPEAPVAWDGEVAACLERASAGGSAPRDAGARTEDASAEGKGSSGASVQGAAPAPARPAGPSGSSTQVWSDFLSVRLHPKSIYVIRQYMHDGECGCLEAFGQGERLLQDPSCLEELEDRLHFYVEECDYLQGFQVLCDLHDGFSGVGAKVTELLYDEYSGKGILTWGLTPVLSNVGDHQKNFYRLMNTALGIVHLSSHSSLFCPLSLSGSLGIRPQPPLAFPYINYDASLHYHSSAILAAALDTLTAPYRLCSSQGSMMHLAETLNFSGRKGRSWGACSGRWFVSPSPTRRLWLRGLLFLFLPYVAARSPILYVPTSRTCPGSFSLHAGSKSCPGKQPPSPLHACESTEQVLQHYLHTLFPGAFSTSHVLEQPCHTLPPYPQFFSPLLTRQGFLQDKPPSYSSAAVESIPVLAGLQSSPALRTLLRSLHQDLHQADVRRWPSFFSAGVEHEDFQEALQELRTLAQCYETGFEADESEDEADSD
ncbi:protein misato homolog 1 isoform X2 [Athene noctua]|uniref:protein misato homolog 1 isoform X2 n=1 Tax=Athene noctua TaxID=126797 RepID=UPI003EBAB0B1